ncbi:MAG TPA: helix-turn-helix domain-containing protein [Paludibacter sp.]
MENHASLFVNTALIMVCAAMATVFLTLPLPPNKGLKKYKVSLRFLAGAYLCIAILKLSFMSFHVAIVNLISMDILTVSSIRLSLFSIALIILINPQFITRIYLFKQLSPVVILNLLYWSIVTKWGDPLILNLVLLKEHALEPTLLIRELFLIYFIFQLLYLTNLFITQLKLYENQVDNYYADSYHLQMTWVKYSYLAILLLGISSLISFFFISELWILIFSICYVIYYLVFAIYYIQYPKTFVLIEPIIFPLTEITETNGKINKKLVWNELKKLIIEEKYYLKPGVNIQDMSHFLKIGRTTLSIYINNEEGINFNMWINSLRIEEAKRLLIEYPKHNLIEISEMVGFSESSNFSRHFKIITKVSPSIWRQSHLS